MFGVSGDNPPLRRCFIKLFLMERTRACCLRLWNIATRRRPSRTKLLRHHRYAMNNGRRIEAMRGHHSQGMHHPGASAPRRKKKQQKKRQTKTLEVVGASRRGAGGYRYSRMERASISIQSAGAWPPGQSTSSNPIDGVGVLWSWVFWVWGGRGARDVERPPRTSRELGTIGSAKRRNEGGVSPIACPGKTNALFR